MFVGVDPSMGHVDHICLESPPQAKQSKLTEKTQNDQTPDAISAVNQEGTSDGASARNEELEENQSDQTSGPVRQDAGSKVIGHLSIIGVFTRFLWQTP